MSDENGLPVGGGAAARGPGPADRAVVYAGAAFASFYAFLLYVPVHPKQFSISLDDSWRAVEHVAFADGMAWGREIVFTYGPLGLLASNHYYPRTYGVLLLAWTFLSVVLVGNARAILRAAAPGLVAHESGQRSVVLVGAIAFVSLTSGEASAREAALLALPMLLAIRCLLLPRRRPDWLVLALAVAAAMSGFVKFSLMIGVLAVVVCVALDDLLERSVPWVAVVFAASVPTLWVASGQRLAGFPAYVRTGIEVAGSYSGAMGTTIRPASTVWVEVVAFLVAAAVLVGLAAAAAGTAARRRALGPVTIAALLFLLFKASFVRQDQHVLIGAHLIAASALLLAPLAVARLGRTPYAILLGVVGLGVALVFATTAAQGSGQVEQSLFQSPSVWQETVRTQAQGLKAMVLDPDSYRREYEENSAFLDSISGLPAIDGTVDLYTVSQSRVITKGYAYNPRPVFQSYNVWTQGLADLNADHLRGPSAPDVIFYDLAVPDDRLPSQDDAASWLPLLEGYEGVGIEGACYTLRRAAAPRRVALNEVFERTVAFGDSIDIPPTDGGPIWLSVTVTPTAFGSLARWFFRSAAVWIDVETPVPLEKSRFRIVPATAPRGFLISPLVVETQDLAAVFGGEGSAAAAPMPVRRVRILADRPLLSEYQPSVHVAVYRVEVAAGASAPAPSAHTP